jgi:hypothetical protein
MALTAWCIAVALGGIVAIGVPVAWLINGRRPLTEEDWIKAPFLGVATIVLCLQNLVYLDLPIGKTAPFLWGAALVLWKWLYRSGQLPVTLARCPRALFGLALLAYLVQGLGLLLVGARAYVGRAWGDEYGYTSLAQFFLDERFSLKLSDLDHRPYMLGVLVELRTHRIGQAMLQAFVAVGSGGSAKTAFEPTILLCAPLLVLAIFALARGLDLGRGRALAAALVAGLLPGLALVHLESFLSQALATPFLLFLPAGLHDLARRPDRRRLAALALIFAAAASVYAEVWPILLGVTVLVLGLTAVRHARPWHLAGYGLALAASAFVLNPGFTPHLLKIQMQLGGSVLGALYPWAYRLEGLACLWLGDVVQGEPLTAAHGLARGCGLAITALGYGGLLLVCWRRLPLRGRPRAWSAFALAAGILALALLPMALLARDNQHPYQFYKLLLSISPLLVLGLASLGARTASDGSSPAISAAPGSETLRPAALVPLAVVGVLAVVGTTRMTLQTTTLVPTRRCLAAYYQAPAIGDTQARLEALHNRDLLIATPYGGHNRLRNPWLAYFARHNRVRLADPHVAGWNLEHHDNPGGSALRAGTTMPEGFLLMSAPGTFQPGPHGDARLLWQNDAYELWQPGPGPWAVPLAEMHRDGPPDIIGGRVIYWMDRGLTRLEVLASTPGTLTLTGRVRGCSATSAGGTRLRIETSGGYSGEALVDGDHATVAVPVQGGKNVILLVAPDAPAAPVPAAERANPRFLAAERPGLQLAFTPASAAP